MRQSEESIVFYSTNQRTTRDQWSLFNMRRQLFFQRTVKQLSTSTSSPSSSTPWQTYVLRSAAVVGFVTISIPCVFIYQVQTDMEFRDHFDMKYPEVMEALRKRMDIKKTMIVSEEEIRKERMNVAVAKMASGRRFRVRVTSSATMEEIKKATQEHGATEEDTVVDVRFEDHVEEEQEEQGRTDDEIEILTALDKGETVPVSTWPQVRPSRATKKMDPKVRAEWNVNEMVAKVEALEDEKRQGTREIDLIEEELQQARNELERLSPSSKKWLKWF